MIHWASRAGPISRAIVIAPTFDDRARICETVIHSVGRGSASWITRSATRIEYGSLNFVCGVTIPIDSAAEIVTSLNVEPGSKVSVTLRFRCSGCETSGVSFASYPGACAIASTAPVLGSRTIALASFARQSFTVWRSTCSACAWMMWSIVVCTSAPSRTARDLTMSIGRPNGSSTCVCTPGLPESCELYCSSSPPSPLSSVPA